uniref:Uncharacterized protein n=1 Tax=Meloidogyne hapla TaxID=6305 RepID=A0A1I8C0W2_MELHA
MALVPEEIPTTSADEATKEFFGYFVEVDCGEEGFYSGRVTQVEPADNNLCTWGKIKLETPFRNGVPLGEQLAIIVPGQLIGNIKVLNMPSQQPQPFVFTPTKPPQIAPQTPRPSISLHQTQHPRISLQQQRTPHQPQHSLQQPPKFPFQPPRFPLQQQPPKLPLQQQPQHSLHQQRFPVQPFSSFPLFERNPVIRTNSGIQGFQRKIFKNRTQNVQITEQNNNKTQKFVPRIVEINKKAEKVVTPKNVQQQNNSKRMEKSVQKGEQKKRIESTSNQAQKNFENIVKDEKLKEQVARNAELFAKLKIDVQKTIEDQQKTEDLKKIEEQQKLKAQKKKIGDQFKKKIQEHIKKSEEEENKKKIKKEENEEDKNIKNEEKKSLKQQNSFEIQSSSTGPNVGDLASVRCPNGIYQGVVNQINAEEQTIRLEKPLL